MNYPKVFMQARFYPHRYQYAIISFFQPLLKYFFLLFLLFLLTSCAHYKVFTQDIESSTASNQQPASSHWLYRIVPRHRCQLKWYDFAHWSTWMLFGNDDDGIFGESQKKPYSSQQPNNFCKALKWWLRNPLHNFCFYTIGSANRTNSEFTILNIHQRGVCLLHYHPIAKRTFGSPNSSLFIALHGGKPLLSLRLNYSHKYTGQFYCGWRERGNFGFKLHPFKKQH